MTTPEPDLEANKQFVRDHFEEFLTRRTGSSPTDAQANRLMG